jgi:hypothetical protein
MRMYPVMPFAMRSPDKSFNVGGLPVYAGTTCLASLRAMHMSGVVQCIRVCIYVADNAYFSFKTGHLRL